ncbi:hypothetical protein H8I69_06010 [Serratia fonticola]|uniref:hypothetical protein n=1 Tax=Serratia fonticola TaxID=47917 RepID=UPI0015C62EFF|nr:hypothetical protein [Serratia fonticola]MBC3378672.1 hypothetical protein [Serratia fonticola]NYA37872.1 hypothetical protein [Serratia fonticola]
MSFIRCVSCTFAGCLSAFFLAVFSSVMASKNNLNFIGAVTNTTCDVYVEVNGAPGNGVDLGRAVIGQLDGKNAADFVLKPVITQSGCMGLTAQNNVTIAWAGNFSVDVFLFQGLLGSQSGTATDSGLYWYYHRPGLPDAPQFVTRMTHSVTLPGDRFLQEGANFHVVLVPGVLTGVFQAAAAYAVSYN